MRKILIAIAASFLIAVSSAVSLEQVNSKFLQSAMAQQDDAASPLVLAEREESAQEDQPDDEFTKALQMMVDEALAAEELAKEEDAPTVRA